MKAVGQEGGEGMDKEEGGKGGKHTPGFLQHPQYELSRNKPGPYCRRNPGCQDLRVTSVRSSTDPGKGSNSNAASGARSSATRSATNLDNPSASCDVKAIKMNCQHTSTAVSGQYPPGQYPPGQYPRTITPRTIAPHKVGL
jgi:hypothetical protein